MENLSKPEECEPRHFLVWAEGMLRCWAWSGGGDLGMSLCSSIVQRDHRLHFHERDSPVSGGSGSASARDRKQSRWPRLHIRAISSTVRCLLFCFLACARNSSSCNVSQAQPPTVQWPTSMQRTPFSLAAISIIGHLLPQSNAHILNGVVFAFLPHILEGVPSRT